MGCVSTAHRHGLRDLDTRCSQYRHVVGPVVDNNTTSLQGVLDQTPARARADLVSTVVAVACFMNRPGVIKWATTQWVEDGPTRATEWLVRAASLQATECLGELLAAPWVRAVTTDTSEFIGRAYALMKGFSEEKRDATMGHLFAALQRGGLGGAPGKPEARAGPKPGPRPRRGPGRPHRGGVGATADPDPDSPEGHPGAGVSPGFATMLAMRALELGDTSDSVTGDNIPLLTEG